MVHGARDLGSLFSRRQWLTYLLNRQHQNMAARFVQGEGQPGLLLRSLGAEHIVQREMRQSPHAHRDARLIDVELRRMVGEEFVRWQVGAIVGMRHDWIRRSKRGVSCIRKNSALNSQQRIVSY